MRGHAIETDLVLRPATAGDMTAVAAIYNHYVLHATCTFAEEPEHQPYWDAWLIAHSGANAATHPALVAARDGEVVGWGTLSRWNSRCAYRFSVEDSVYVKPDRHRQGIGQTVLARLIELARAQGHRSIVAQIADHQAASEKLHEQFGFRRVGTLQHVGFKFNRWIDVSIFQLSLDANDS